jgi:hypothetical protein
MLRELAAKVGVQVDSGDLVSFMGALDVAKGQLAGLGGMLLGGAFAVFAKDTIDAADKLGDTAERIGVSTDELQRFQYALKLTGGETEGAEKALFLFNKTIGDAASGGGGAGDAFASMGIKLKDANGHVKSASELMPDVADKIAEAGSEAEKTALATKLFGKSGLTLLPLLKRGREGLAELNSEYDVLGGGISAEVIKSAGETNDEFDRIHHTTTVLGATFLGMFLPVISEAAKWFLKITAGAVHLAKTTNVLKIAFGILGVVGAVKLIPVIMSSVRAFMALRTAVFGASVPFWAVVAVVGALFLIFEDLWTLMAGGDSLIGEVLDKFGGIGAKEKLVKTLKDSWASLKKTWEDIKPVLDSLWKKLAEGSTGAVPALAEAFSFVVRALVAGVSAFTALIAAAGKAAQGDWGGALKEIEGSGDSIFGKKQAFWDKKTGLMIEENVGGLFGKSEGEWKKFQDDRNGGPVTVTNTATNNITVNAGNLPADKATKAVKDGVAKGVQGKNADAYNAAVNGEPEGTDAAD